MVQVVSCQPVTAKAGVQTQVSPRQIFGGQTDIGMDFPPLTCVCPCQYNSTNALYLFIHVSLIQYDFQQLPVLLRDTHNREETTLK